MTTIRFKTLDILSNVVSGSLWITPLKANVKADAIVLGTPREVSVRSGEAVFDIPHGIKYRFDFIGKDYAEYLGVKSAQMGNYPVEHWSKILFVPQSDTEVVFVDLFTAVGEVDIDITYQRILDRLLSEGYNGGESSTVDLTAVYQALDGKAASNHTHTEFSSLDSRITSNTGSIDAINQALLGKSAAGHTHSEFSSLIASIAAIDAALIGKVDSTDSRLSNAREPIDGSVTSAKLSATFTLPWGQVSGKPTLLTNGSNATFGSLKSAAYEMGDDFSIRPVAGGLSNIQNWGGIWLGGLAGDTVWNSKSEALIGQYRACVLVKPSAPTIPMFGASAVNATTLIVKQASWQNGLSQEWHDKDGVSKAQMTHDGAFTAARLKPSAYTVATLPNASVAGAGAMVYATNGRKSGEATGAGSGVPVWSNGTSWLTFYDNAVVSA